MGSRRIAVMQPYFFPYIGYWQLLDAADVFVVYDNLKYTKKGWINRNRFLEHGVDRVFSIPLEADSDAKHIDQRHVSKSFDRTKLLRRIKTAYRRAPHFESAFSIFSESVSFSRRNLFDFLHHSILRLAAELSFDVSIIPSSAIPIDHNKRSQDKVLDICKTLNATEYINPIGGTQLYAHEAFESIGVDLHFVHTTSIRYTQFKNEFVPWLSILDILMFNSLEQTSELIRENYTLVRGDEPWLGVEPPDHRALSLI
ncbi:MAG: WbqC family protein [Planctomycetota bacterium]